MSVVAKAGGSADHAGRMDAIYAGQRHIYDLTRKYYLLGRDALIRDLAPPPGGTVLEVGCGTARNLIAAAKRWPDAQLRGFDISDAMLVTARGNIGERPIAVTRGDASDFDAKALFDIATFDRVFLSYTLSMIPDWQRAIEQATAALAPGGELHIVDFGQQERLPRRWRTLLFAWLAKFDVAPRRELPAVLRRIAAARGLGLEFRSLYRGYAWSARLTRAA